MSLNRICRLSHSVPLNQDRCSEGHPLAASLQCLMNDCNFVTDPIIMSKFESALSLLKIHMTAAHTAINKSSDEDKSADKLEEPDSDDEATDKKTCPLCFKIFHNKLNMKRHRKIHHDGSMRLKCSDCEKTFASKTALQYHKNRNHAEDAKLTCNGCNKQFSSSKTLELHEKSHNINFKKKSFKCVDCKKIFSSSSNLRRHDREVHYIININLRMWEKEKKESLKTKPFKCSVCDYKTKRRHYLKVHIEQVHRSETDTDFQCTKC